jgi:hypothetical protein
MKKKVKIALIAVVIIGIILAIVLFVHKIIDGGSLIIKDPSIEQKIQSRVNKEIKGQEYPIAQRGFYSILDDIYTEQSITLGTGEKNLDDEEILKSLQIAFYEYAPIFTEYGKSYFMESSWNKTILKKLREEAITLLNLKIVEESSAVDVDIRSIVQNVDDYRSAWSIVRSANNCTTIADIDNVKSKANQYLKDPLINNTKLVSAIHGVEINARSAVVRSITKSCAYICVYYEDYPSYASFNEAYEYVCALIEGYEQRYGYESELQQAREKLRKAKGNAYSHFAIIKNK